MKRTSVSSTNVRSWGYDAATSELELELVSGEVFAYQQVPQSVADALAKSKDIRASVLSLVKGKYSYRKVEPDGQAHNETA